MQQACGNDWIRLSFSRLFDYIYHLQSFEDNAQVKLDFDFMNRLHRFDLIESFTSEYDPALRISPINHFLPLVEPRAWSEFT